MSSRGERTFRGLPLEALDVLGGRFLDDARVHVSSELIVLGNHWGSPLVEPEALRLLPGAGVPVHLHVELSPVDRMVSF